MMFYLLLLSYVRAFPFAVIFLILICAHIQLRRENLYTVQFTSDRCKEKKSNPSQNIPHTMCPEDTSGMRSQGEGLLTTLDLTSLHLILNPKFGSFPLHSHRKR